MIDWNRQLTEIEDEYLIGLTNKGIVKRAYKDKEKADFKILKLEDEASLQVDGETVVLSIPLGESKCSCPSRSICKHIILGILALKESVGGEDSAATVTGTSASVELDTADGVSENSASLKKDTVDKVSENIASGESNTVDPSNNVSSGKNDTVDPSNNVPSGKSDTDGPSGSSLENKNSNTAGSSLQKRLWDEIRIFPEKDLYKIMGNRRLTSFYNKACGNIMPEIEESSVFTLQLPGENTTVKLLSPLEYSSCTCHKKDLCIHKAEAILWCKLKAGVLSLNDLAMSGGKDTSLNPEQVREVSLQIKSFLEELMATGLSRIPPDVTNSLERFAIISHNAGLPVFEKAFRTLSTFYQSYLSRKASFQTMELMQALTKLYSKVNIFLETEDISLLAKKAGEFRAEYLPVGDLSLVGITMEHFDAADAAGYEGETVYFLETSTKKWYTYTIVRPAFYDGRRKMGKPGKAEAPWGLNCSLENLVKLEIDLKDVRCDGRRRLSSSKETRGDIIGAMQPDFEALSAWYYEDFGKLFAEQIPNRAVSRAALSPQTGEMGNTAADENIWGRDLVFIQPAFCDKAVFSKTEQALSMTLYDKEKRQVILELPYSKEDAKSIQYLEKIKEDKPPCFIGKIYLRDGRIRLIPVDTWGRQ